MSQRRGNTICNVVSRIQCSTFIKLRLFGPEYLEEEDMWNETGYVGRGWENELPSLVELEK